MAKSPEVMLSDYRSSAEKHLVESLKVKQLLLEQCLDGITAFSLGIAEALAEGKKLLLCGNGGSAADAQHMAAELVVRLSSSFERRALPAIALTTDSSLLTACANDYSFNEVFARQVEAFGQRGDIVIGISTSGNSGNVGRAFEVAKQKQCRSFLLSGGTGGKLKPLADKSILVPSAITAHIQECHIAIIHIICDIIEQHVCGKA